MSLGHGRPDVRAMLHWALTATFRGHGATAAGKRRIVHLAVIFREYNPAGDEGSDF